MTINDTVCPGIVDACVRSRIASAVDDRIPASMLSEKPPKPVEPEPLTRRDAPKCFNRRRHDPERSHSRDRRRFRPYAGLVEDAATPSRVIPTTGVVDFR